MPSTSSATEAARHLWTRYAGGKTSAEEFATAADQLFSQLEAGLARWVGAEGSRVLRGRALKLAQAQHRALRDFSDGGWDVPVVVSAVKAHGAPDVAAGFIAVIATLIDLLGRIIGQEMAVRLVEQTGAPGPRGQSNIRKQGERHG